MGAMRARGPKTARQPERATDFARVMAGYSREEKGSLLAAMRWLLRVPTSARLWRVVGLTGAVEWLVTEAAQ